MPVSDHSPTPVAGETPFRSAEEAWFWFMAWRLMVEDGGTPGYDGRGRPCMPLDMLACLRRLVKPGRLTRRQVKVLAAFGRRLEAPGHGPLARLWEDAMARLDELLRAKGIVARNATKFKNGGVGAAVARNATKFKNGGVGAAVARNATKFMDGGVGAAARNATKFMDSGVGAAARNATKFKDGGRRLAV